MKILLILFVIGIFISSCRKQEETQGSNPVDTTIQAKEFQPLTVGSYWIYQQFTVYNADSELALNNYDSLFVYGDTMIHSDTFAIFRSTPLMLGHEFFLLRDSSGYLVNETGIIKFSVYNFSDTLFIDSINVFVRISYKMADKDSLIQVPIGTYPIYDYRAYIYSNEYPGEVRSSYNFYSKNIGLVKANVFFYSQFENPVYTEYRLVRYHIQ
jgi:hypothetical protein